MNNTTRPISTLLLASALCSGVAVAAELPAHHASPQANTIPQATPQDPYAQVYVVTSRETYSSAQSLFAGASLHTDSIGTPLVIAETHNHQLGQLAEHVHHNERRCGGFFAFATRAEAEAFLRNDRSAQAIQRTLLADYTIDNQATVDPWLPQVSEQNIYATIDHLQSYTNRHYASPTGKSSAEWIRDTWQALGEGRSDVSTELFNCDSCSTQPSVILTVQGTELPDEVVVLGAHLDSINWSAGGGADQPAPGADDDASGIASLTEVIRIALAEGWKPKRTVKFMGYAAEEVGKYGSNAIATAFRDAGTNVVGVLQLDMTNYKSGAVEDMQLVTDYSNEELKTFFTQLFDEYLAPMGLTRGAYTCTYGCSDHASWTAAGYPAAMMFEAGDSSGYNPNIHSKDDTLASMGESAQNSVKFAQFGLAFLGELAKTDGGSGPGNQSPAADFTSSGDGLTVQFTDKSTDSDGSVASHSWDFGDGTTSDEASPSKTYDEEGTYMVTLTVTDNDGATNTKSAEVAVGGGGAQTYINDRDIAIRDLKTVASGVEVSGRDGDAPADAQVAVAIEHTSIGDLKVRLMAPDGSVYVLHDRADEINQTYTVDLSGEAMNGRWKLKVTDHADQNTGKIDSWSLTF